jgi:hypothetical protein
MRQLDNLSTITLIICSIFLLFFAVNPVQIRAESNNPDVILVPVNYDALDQVVTVLNKTGKEVVMSGFKVRDGSGNVFEFPTGEPTVLEPFGILRVHSGPGAEEEYSGGKDFYWTSESIWTEAKKARLVNPSGEVVSELDLSATGSKDLLAGCLTRKEVKMYGLVTCPHCQSQKEEFGNSVRYVNYVECTENRKTCVDAGIRRVPAWVFEESDRRKVGSRSLESLSSLAGCNFKG